MSVEAVVHRLRCDHCRAAWISPVANNPTQAREAAALNGWTRVDSQDVCPRCARRQVRDSALVGGAGS